MEAVMAACSSTLLGASSIATCASSSRSTVTASSSSVSLAKTFCPPFAATVQKEQQGKNKGFKGGLRSVLPPAAAADGGAVALEVAAEDKTAEELPIEKRYAAFPAILDITYIRNVLPHRFPFLLVDRVIEYNPGVSAVGIKNVTINDNFFPGHFPDRPIMPGVLMVEAMAQVGGIVMLNPEVGGSKENFFFAGVDKVRFRKPVVAGDTLVMRMTLTKLQKRFGIAKMEGKAYVGGEVVCEGEFMMALGSEEQTTS
ncbi:unnamed protein product [Calypogeia fissa]